LARGAGAFDRDAATVSRCSCRHAADPWLTKKDGKQEAKEDDDEQQTEQHVRPGFLRFRWSVERCGARQRLGR